MAIVRWDSYRDVTALQERISRMLEGLYMDRAACDALGVRSSTPNSCFAPLTAYSCGRSTLAPFAVTLGVIWFLA